MAPGTAASASSKKRRFQVPITQYFSPSPSQQTESEPSSHFNYNAPTHSAHPSLPPTIQSSLLAVGMRVRKAVPEGYRTKLAAKANNHQSKTSPRDEQFTDSSISPAYTELIPFSGAFKVGNYGVQSFPQPSAAVTEPMTAARQLDEESLPFSSQDSTQSFESSSSLPRPNSYKRGFEIEEDDEDFDGQDSFPSRIHPSHSRPILLPRSGRQRTLRSKASSPSSSLLKGRSEQENWDIAFNFDNGGGGDFEDAKFLKRREDVDEEYLRRAREVRMGGV
ncbi:S-phase delaying protein 1 [Trichophyton interdigitale]|nr:S-phase delaying protein 1 [Trichophyton interdigitale]KAG5218884.1 S-phase delaying protein 1 [Trichophyton interdigitale]KAG8212227.1 S-phase delaying protein 1 [Trichophyton interdigitale]